MPALISRTAAPGLVVAVLVGLHKLLHASFLVNDDFMHRAYARQLQAGDAPVRDFFDYGMGLMYALSALAEAAFGYRLLSEAVIVGALAGVAAFLVFDVVRRATGSTTAGVFAALLLLVATPRSYAYPKLVVYAVAAWLWWRYVLEPDPRRALALGLWAGVAFSWRPDHGAYVAIGVALAMIAAHGWERLALTRLTLGGAAALTLVAPWLVFASLEAGGFVRYVQSGVTAATEEHRVTGRVVPAWPVRRPGDLLRVDPPRLYAPVVGIRWTGESTAETRQAVLERYELEVVDMRDDRSGHVRLSPRAVRQLRALIAEPIVEDTDDIDRGAGRVSRDEWPAARERRFSHWWLRVRILPGLDASAAAGEAAAILLVAIPVLALGGAFLLRAHLPAGGTPLAWFAVFALVVDLGLLRTPFNVRAGDAIVLPAVALALLAIGIERAGRVRAGWQRWASRLALAVMGLLLVKTLVVTGQPGERIGGLLTGRGPDPGAWADVRSRLWSSPPIGHWRDREPEATLRLAAYAHECLAADERILALWFAPEIYYYADRLMAGRHAFFLPGLGALPHEQAMELEKVRRSPPQMVFVKAGSTREARETFPALFALVAREYRAGARLDADDRYDVFVRRDRVPTRTYGADAWPCYTEA